VTYIDSRGRRVTTESAYLTPAVLSRPNLTVAVNASVTRIIFDTTGSNPRAVGVEFSSRDRLRFRVRAKKEVILAYVERDKTCFNVHSLFFLVLVLFIPLMLVFNAFIMSTKC
jgi:choline dehydrogenase-like flavoprotein